MPKKVKPIRDCRDARDFTEYAEYYGGYEKRCNGDHHIWQLPNNVEVPIPYKRKSDDIMVGTRGSIIRRFKEAGIAVVFLGIGYFLYCYIGFSL